MHTRFAPSPTGRLHLGHVAAMIHVWGLADLYGAQVGVRIEDHDRQRCRPEFLEHLRDDLEWLGFGPQRGGAWSQQSLHSARFEHALARLRDQGLIYACRCSRKTLAGAATGIEQCYSGTCRHLNLPETAETCLRVRLPDDQVVFRDARHGPQRQHPASQCGDFVVRDRLGQWTYQFAVVVDDLEEEIDWIIRGDDLLASTGRQLLLAKLLGRRQPLAFHHHSLILNAQGVKLSKRDAAAPLAALRDQGRSAAEVIGLAAFQSGLQPEPRPLAADDCATLFTGWQPANPDVEPFRFD